MKGHTGLLARPLSFGGKAIVNYGHPSKIQHCAVPGIGPNHGHINKYLSANLFLWANIQYQIAMIPLLINTCATVPSLVKIK